MLQRLTASAAAVAWLATASPVSADDIADGVATMPGAVEDVRIGGTWDRGSSSGLYRIVVTRSGGNTITARLFVQWVAFDDDGGSTLIDSIEIEEVGELGIDVIDYISDSDGDGLSVFIQADNPAEPDVDSFELFVFSTSSYMFDVATN